MVYKNPPLGAEANHTRKKRKETLLNILADILVKDALGVVEEWQKCPSCRKSRFLRKMCDQKEHYSKHGKAGSFSVFAIVSGTERNYMVPK